MGAVPGAGRDAPALPGAGAAPVTDGGRRGPDGDETGRVGRGRDGATRCGDCPARADDFPCGDGRARAGAAPGVGCRFPEAGIVVEGAPTGGRAGPDRPVPYRAWSGRDRGAPSREFPDGAGPVPGRACWSGPRPSTPPPAEPAEPTVRTAVSAGSSAWPHQTAPVTSVTARAAVLVRR
ncbi:hypothetical protein [Streptomyces phaeoluteigriseus]|uniref:hypothetical protein n=1 Tax=Streptomyces phaeoluteigriseus TaxID=114686 RepID=UPI0036807760